MRKAQVTPSSLRGEPGGGVDDPPPPKNEEDMKFLYRDLKSEPILKASTDLRFTFRGQTGIEFGFKLKTLKRRTGSSII